MTYGEAKSRCLKMQDELKPKSDLLEKLPGFFDAAQKEVAQYYPIWREKRYSETDERTLPADCWEPWTIQGDGFLWFWGQDAKFDGLPDDFALKYKAWPETITADTPDSQELETQEEAVLAVIYLAAAMCQQMEYNQRYFSTFYSMYQGKMQNLAAPDKNVAVVIEPGFDI